MPYPNEHSCRLMPSRAFVSFRRKNKQMYSEGKPIDVVYGIFVDSNGNYKTRIQSLRYPTSQWRAIDALRHCEKHGGEFHPSKRRT